MKTLVEQQGKVIEKLSCNGIPLTGPGVVTDFNLVPKKPFKKFRKLKDFDDYLNNDDNAKRQMAIIILCTIRKLLNIDFF